MSARPAPAFRAARGLLAAAAAIVLAGALAASSSSTDASWQTAETSHGAFTANLAQPQITGCTARNVFLSGASVTVTWRHSPSLATSPAPAAAYAFSSTGLLNLTGILGTSVTTTGPVAGVYTTTFGSALLSGLLGGTAYVGIGSTQSGWASTYASATATVPALIGTGTCTITP